MVNERLLKKNILQLKYLNEDHDECVEIFNDAKREFDNIVKKLHYDLNSYDEVLDDSDNVRKKRLASEEIEKEVLNNKANPDWAKKLYRKIVVITHPDKLPDGLNKAVKDSLVNKYQCTINAMYDSDFSEIILIASDLGIDLCNLDESYIEVFNSKIKKMHESISKIKCSIYWVWKYASDEKKDAIIQEFIKSRGWTSSEAMRKKSRSGSAQHPGKSIAWARKLSIKDKK